jgi:thiol:disulfide interchange protein DsbD
MVVGLLLLGLARAADECAAVPPAQPVVPTLIAEHASIQPGGATRVGVHFEIEEGWHIYAKNPGDAGLPTEVTWTAPRGVGLGPLRWPKPQRFIELGNIRTNGYTGTIVLASRLVLLTTSTDSEETAFPVRAHVKWLACKDICVPGSADLKLSISVSNQPPAPSASAKLFR